MEMKEVILANIDKQILKLEEDIAELRLLKNRILGEKDGRASDMEA